MPITPSSQSVNAIESDASTEASRSGNFRNPSAITMSAMGMVGRKFAAMGWFRSLSTWRGKRTNRPAQGPSASRNIAMEAMRNAPAAGRTHGASMNEMASGITPVPITAANQAGEKCSATPRNENRGGGDGWGVVRHGEKAPCAERCVQAGAIHH